MLGVTMSMFVNAQAGTMCTSFQNSMTGVRGHTAEVNPLCVFKLTYYTIEMTS